LAGPGMVQEGLPRDAMHFVGVGSSIAHMCGQFHAQNDTPLFASRSHRLV